MSEYEPSDAHWSQFLKDDKGQWSSGRLLCYLGVIILGAMVYYESQSGQQPLYGEMVYVLLITGIYGGKAAGKFAESRK